MGCLEEGCTLVWEQRRVLKACIQPVSRKHATPSSSFKPSHARPKGSQGGAVSKTLHTRSRLQGAMVMDCCYYSIDTDTLLPIPRPHDVVFAGRGWNTLRPAHVWSNQKTGCGQSNSQKYDKSPR